MNVDLVTKWQIITTLKNTNQVCLWIKIQISTLLLVRDCLTDVMSCLRLMGTWWLMTTVHHDHDITWPYDQDMTITTRILPTQHLWWSTKISWIHSSLQRLRIFKFMNIWPEMHWGWRWFEIFTNGRVPTIFMAPGCAGWVVWTPREWGWVIESYQAPSRLLLSCPAHCSTAATLTSTLQTLYYEEHQRDL